MCFLSFRSRNIMTPYGSGSDWEYACLLEVAWSDISHFGLLNMAGASDCLHSVFHIRDRLYCFLRVIFVRFLMILKRPSQTAYKKILNYT